MPSKVWLGRQMARGGEQHRGMAVMAAGVHLAEHLAGPGLAAGFGDGQRVHVGAQADAPGAGARAQCAHDAGAAQAAMHFITPARQTLGHQIGGGVLFIGKLRVAVDLVTDRDHFFFVGADLVEGRRQQGSVHGVAFNGVASSPC